MTPKLNPFSAQKMAPMRGMDKKMPAPKASGDMKRKALAKALRK